MKEKIAKLSIQKIKDLFTSLLGLQREFHLPEIKANELPVSS